MFLDSEIAKKFSCGHTKTAAIINSPPLYEENTACHVQLMMDESTDKTDKFCIILVLVMDFYLGDIRTRFLDMPIVNVGTSLMLLSSL